MAESSQDVAFALLVQVAKSEGKFGTMDFKGVDKKWILDTYAECLQATNGMRDPFIIKASHVK